MKKYLTILCAFLVSFVSIYGQKKSSTLSDTYDRSSLTLILLDHPEAVNTSKLTNGIGDVRIPDKYFDNPVEPKSYKAPYVIDYPGVVTGNIKDLLNQERIGNKVISYWYSRQSDGTMSADRFLERGMYNATDADVLKAKGTKRGVEALKDYGDKLISKSFIVAMDYNLKAVDDAVNRGWSTDAKLFVYKVVFTSEIQAQLYNDFWIYEEDTPEVRAKKKAAFDEMHFDVEFVTQLSTSVTETELKSNTSIISPPKTNDELLSILMQKALNEGLYYAEKKVEELRVVSALYTTNPPKAKIGKKEGLAVDHRYFVYEYVYNEKTNGTEAVRRSVIRAKKVVDNRGVATGTSDMSTFYQIAGGNLEPGMTLQQRNDYGIGLYLGAEMGKEIGGIAGRLEANLGRYTSVPSLYVFIGLASQTATYDEVYNKNGSFLGTTELNFFRYEFGAAKGIRIAKIMELAPYLGVGFEQAKSTDWADDAEFAGNSVKSLYFKFGANLALNLKYNIQVIGGLGSYAFTTASDDNGDLLIGGEKVDYSQIVGGRGETSSGASYLGIRFQF